MRSRGAVTVLLAGLLTGGLIATGATPAHARLVDPPREAGCRPKVALVDRDATPETVCLAARLDGWKRARSMGIGQQLNMSSEQFAGPLVALGDREVPVVGFDLWELGKTRAYEHPFYDVAFADLVARAQAGAVLTATWHAPNPQNGGTYSDRRWHDLDALLRDSPDPVAFWAQYVEQLEVLAAFQDAGVPVVFRPLHEANGDWFWWGRPAPSTYRRLWAALQARAWAAGVHNLLWAYSFAARDRRGIARPERLLPASVDLAGIDTYAPSAGTRRSVPSMSGYAAVAERVTRMAFTEIGPAADTAGSWRPAVISRLARDQRRRPVWALLWVDDGGGRKQLSSFTTGPAWLDSCPHGLCALR